MQSLVKIQHWVEGHWQLRNWAWLCKSDPDTVLFIDTDRQTNSLLKADKVNLVKCSRKLLRL